MAKDTDYRTCPKCRHSIGADLEECPICGADVRTAAIARVVKYVVLLAALGTIATHFLHRL